MQSKKTPGIEENPVWKIINDPDFKKKCEARDPATITGLRVLADLSREKLGKHVREALHRTSDQRVGKVIRALSYAMADLANGDIAFAIFEQCELPKKK